MNFYKLSGAGNDFIALAGPVEEPPTRAIEAWCQRGLSIGADGLFILTPVVHGLKMDHFNSDGLRADLCVNGARCAAQLGHYLGWTDGKTILRTDVGPIPAQRLDSTTVRLDLPRPEAPPEDQTLTANGQPWSGFRVTVGNPHFVMFGPSAEQAELFTEVSPSLRSHAELGPSGANVHFVDPIDSQTIRLRSFERGVEAETLACGTGALASVATGLKTGQLTLPVAAHTRGGFVLKVAHSVSDDHYWSLKGHAEVVFVGKLPNPRKASTL